MDIVNQQGQGVGLRRDHRRMAKNLQTHVIQHLTGVGQQIADGVGQGDGRDKAVVALRIVVADPDHRLGMGHGVDGIGEGVARQLGAHGKGIAGSDRPAVKAKLESFGHVEGQRRVIGIPDGQRPGSPQAIVPTEGEPRRTAHPSTGIGGEGIDPVLHPVVVARGVGLSAARPVPQRWIGDARPHNDLVAGPDQTAAADGVVANGHAVVGGVHKGLDAIGIVNTGVQERHQHGALGADAGAIALGAIARRQDRFRMGARIVGIGPQPLLAAIAIAVQVTVPVHAQQHYRCRRRRGGLKWLAAIAQVVQV